MCWKCLVGRRRIAENRAARWARGVVYALLSTLLFMGGTQELSSQEDSSASSQSHAQLDGFIRFQGPGILTGLGAAIEGHRVLGTLGAEFERTSPIYVKLRGGLQWSFEGWRVWPEYFYHRPISSFVLNELFEGSKTDIVWRSTEDELELAITAHLYLGEFHILHDRDKILSAPAFSSLLGFRMALYRDSLLYTEHAIYADLSGGIIALLDSPDIAYGLDARLPIELFEDKLLIVPIFSWANHSGDRIGRGDSVGYHFNSYSTFGGGVFPFDTYIFGRSRLRENQGNVVFATKLEGRWYFLDLFGVPYVPIYLKAFSDVAFMAQNARPLTEGNFYLAVGGGLGVAWTTLNINANVGYEYPAGFRFSFNIRGSS